MEFPKGGREDHDGQGKSPEDVVDQTAIKASDLLKKSAKEDAEFQRKLAILGLTNTDAAMENLRTAMKMAREHFDLDEDRIFIQKLEGQAVGKAEGKSIYLDPWSVLDSIRCFAVLMHERAHQGKKGKIQNEAVVEAYIRAIAPIAENSDIEEPPRYTEWMAHYNNVLDRLGDRVKMAKWIWEICSEKNYAELWARYKKVVAKAKTDAEKDVIFNDFKNAFPELSYTDGQPEFGRAEINEPVKLAEAA